MTTHDWTGDAKSIAIWGEHQSEVGRLRSQGEFELFGYRWKVERQARRTTFARCVSGQLAGVRIQLKKTKQVGVPLVLRKP